MHHKMFHCLPLNRNMCVVCVVKSTDKLINIFIIMIVRAEKKVFLWQCLAGIKTKVKRMDGFSFSAHRLQLRIFYLVLWLQVSTAIFVSLSQMNIAIQSRQVCCVYGTRVHQHTMKWSKVEIALHINFKWHYSYADCRQHSYIIAKSMSISCHLFNNSFYCFP